MIFFSFFKKLKNKLPISAPYKVLLMGLDVMAHEPDEQPTCCQ